MKRYKVTLEPEERQHLHDLIAAGQAAARKLAHARVLLKADAADGGPAWPDWRIAPAVGEFLGRRFRSSNPCVIFRCRACCIRATLLTHSTRRLARHAPRSTARTRLASSRPSGHDLGT